MFFFKINRQNIDTITHTKFYICSFIYVIQDFLKFWFNDINVLSKNAIEYN